MFYIYDGLTYSSCSPIYLYLIEISKQKEIEYLFLIASFKIFFKGELNTLMVKKKRVHKKEESDKKIRCDEMR